MDSDVVTSATRTFSEDTRLPSANPVVVYQQLPDGGVLFNPAREYYYGLNLTGACIWENLAPACDTIEAVCEVVSRRFPGADGSTVRVHVENLIARLSEHGLVIPT